MALDCFNPSGLDDMRVQTGHIQGNVPAGVYGARPRARFAGTFCLKGDTRDCGAEPLPAAETGEAEQGQTQRPRPADETGSCVWRSAPVFASGHRPAPRKSAKRKRQTQRPRPADETGSCVWRSAPVFASGHRPAPRKSAKRKRQTQRPRPADETGSCVWRSAPVFASGHRPAPRKSAKRKRQTQRPRPADETGSCVWRSAPVFASGHRPAPRKSAKRKRNAVCLLQGRHDARRKSREPQPRISVPRLRAEMGPPLENF